MNRRDLFRGLLGLAVAPMAARAIAPKKPSFKVTRLQVHGSLGVEPSEIVIEEWSGEKLLSRRRGREIQPLVVRIPPGAERLTDSFEEPVAREPFYANHSVRGGSPW